MKIFWTDFASGTLTEIYEYYKEKASPIVARKIKSEIFKSTQQLKQFPHSGHVELNLQKLLVRSLDGIKRPKRAEFHH